MIALDISSIKDFMHKLLCTDTFDHFLLKEATIQTGITWNLEGELNNDFYSSEELDELGLTGLSFLPFGQVRAQCFDLIKGKRTPSYFKFVFLLSPENLSRTLQRTHSAFTPEDITGMPVRKAAAHDRDFLPHFFREQEPGAGMGFTGQALSFKPRNKF